MEDDDEDAEEEGLGLDEEDYEDEKEIVGGVYF